MDWPFNLFFYKLHIFANLNFYIPLCALISITLTNVYNRAVCIPDSGWI